MVITGLSALVYTYPQFLWIPAVIAAASAVGIHAIPSINQGVKVTTPNGMQLMGLASPTPPAEVAPDVAPTPEVSPTEATLPEAAETDAEAPTEATPPTPEPTPEVPEVSPPVAVDPVTALTEVAATLTQIANSLRK